MLVQTRGLGSWWPDHTLGSNEVYLVRMLSTKRRYSQRPFRVVVTAANDSQARVYNLQLAGRLAIIPTRHLIDTLLEPPC